MQKQQEQPMKKPVLRRIVGPCATVFTAANTGSWRLEKPVVDPGKCIRCGICEMYCPVGCITISKTGDPFIVNWQFCKGCGVCVNECPRKALNLVEEREV